MQSRTADLQRQQQAFDRRLPVQNEQIGKALEKWPMFEVN